MNEIVKTVEKQYEDLKYEYAVLVGGCIRILKFNNYVLFSNIQQFNEFERQKLKK